MEVQSAIYPVSFSDMPLHYNTLTREQLLANLSIILSDWWKLYKRPMLLKHIKWRYAKALGHLGLTLDAFLCLAQERGIVTPLLWSGRRYFADSLAWNALGEERRMIIELELTQPKYRRLPKTRRQITQALIHNQPRRSFKQPHKMSMQDIIDAEAREAEGVVSAVSALSKIVTPV